MHDDSPKYNNRNKTNGDSYRLDRRALLAGGGVAALAGAVSGGGALAAADANAVAWDKSVDVICVGSGAAALSAAVTATHEGQAALVLEKAPMIGGTTAKSGAVFWIPNNFVLRERGIDDERTACLQYLCRFAYPARYTPDSPTMGLEPEAFRLIEAFYDNGYVMTDFMRDIGALKVAEWRMYHLDRPATDYLSHVPENKVPTGRALAPDIGGGKTGWGTDMIAQFEAWLKARDVPILTNHEVVEIVMKIGAAVGVKVAHEGKVLAFGARKGVVFGTGGFSHNPELINLHQPGNIYGSCAQASSTGDFIGLGAMVGAKMGNLWSAWRTQVVLEETLENRVVGLGVFVVPGDSMLIVNKYGQRAVNEKRNYNDRTRIHYVYDPGKAEFPNHLMFMIYDRRTADIYRGSFPYPQDPDKGRFVIKASSLEQLAAKIDARLAQHAAKIGGVRLADGFSGNLQATVARFNGFARAGKDADFGRGANSYDTEWDQVFGVRRESDWPANDLANLTMYPLADKGPFYAVILAPGALDTNGGPVINARAQIINGAGEPIPGLYGAGNCIACPSHTAYYGAGGTIGLALTFGYIAGRQVAKQAARKI